MCAEASKLKPVGHWEKVSGSGVRDGVFRAVVDHQKKYLITGPLQEVFFEGTLSEISSEASNARLLGVFIGAVYDDIVRDIKSFYDAEIH